MKKNRFFGGMVHAQAKWLNEQARSGWRLERTGKMSYEFTACQPGEYQYAVEFVGYLSQTESIEYKQFLEEMGYRVWYKNINLQWSTGKVQYRPWANKGGRIATNGTTIDKELLIVEKLNDGTPFVLHTSLEDRIHIARRHRDTWLLMLLICLVGGLVLQSLAFYILSGLCLVPVLVFQVELCSLQKEARIEE